MERKCFNCKHKNDVSRTLRCAECADGRYYLWTPMTNADKYFRNATDEELAKIIVRAKYFDKFCEIVLAGENPGFCDDDCYKCCLEWLKQEVSDERG